MHCWCKNAAGGLGGTVSTRLSLVGSWNLDKINIFNHKEGEMPAIWRIQCFLLHIIIIKKEKWPEIKPEWMGFNYLNATEPLWGDSLFYQSVLRSYWYSFDQPQKDKRLHWPSSNPVILSMELLDWDLGYCSIKRERSPTYSR